MDAQFIRDRITGLRLNKGVSEYTLSYELGHSKNYIQNITSGRALPSMKEFLYICDYFGITPRQFFDEEIANPILVQKALDGMKAMKDKDLLTLIGLIDRLNEQAVGTPLDSPAKYTKTPLTRRSSHGIPTNFHRAGFCA